MGLGLTGPPAVSRAQHGGIMQSGAILDLYGWHWGFIVPRAISIAIAWILEL